MKKISVIFAALALLAASCTKTEVVSSDVQSSQRGIGFSAYTAKPTKAAQEDVKTANLTSFQVSAIGNGAVYFDNVTFMWKSGSNVWESNPLYFWPAFKLNFYAYNTPEKGTFGRTINATDPQTLTFTPSTVLAEQEDLVAAFAKDQTDPSGATSLTFNHYLTQIVVKALNTNPTYGVEVAGVKIAHMDDKVKYTFSTGNTEVATDAADETYSSEFTAKTLTAEAQEVMTASTNNKWYLVPQEVTAWDQDGDQTNNSKGTYLALKVKITANNGALNIYPTSGDYAWMAVPVSGVTEFVKGHKYTFLIKFFQNNGAGYVDPEVPSDINGDGDAVSDKGKPIIGGAITFNANVSTWAPETVITIEL